MVLASALVTAAAGAVFATHADAASVTYPSALGPVPVGSVATFTVHLDPGDGHVVEPSTNIAGGGYPVWDFKLGACSTTTSDPCDIPGRFAPSRVADEAITVTFHVCTLGDPADCFPVPLHITASGVSVTGGSLSATPTTFTAGGSTTLNSQTPCRLGSQSAQLTIFSGQGNVVATQAATLFDAGGNWAGVLSVPSSTPAGSYLASASCMNRGNVVQAYTFVPLTVTPAEPAPTGLVADTVHRTSPLQFRATLTSSGRPVSGASVSFTTTSSGRGISQCTATTNAAGVAACSGRNALSAAGTSYYRASFTGTSAYVGAAATGRFG